jgi:hypothetical protein
LLSDHLSSAYKWSLVYVSPSSSHSHPKGCPSSWRGAPRDEGGCVIPLWAPPRHSQVTHVVVRSLPSL